MKKRFSRRGAVKSVHDNRGRLEFLSLVVRLKMGRKGEKR
jgi:hypothetical protein